MLGLFYVLGLHGVDAVEDGAGLLAREDALGYFFMNVIASLSQYEEGVQVGTILGFLLRVSD